MFFSRERASLLVPLLLAASIASLGAPARASVRSFDGVWSALADSIPAPSARREHAAIYDAPHHRYLLFGGYGFASTAPEQNFNEGWTLSLDDPATWSLLTVAGSPPGPRKGVQWGYDPARQRVLIFGGYGEHHPGDLVSWQNDVWQLSLDGTPTWTELFPTGTPPAGRLAGISVYDPLRQRFVGFGGTDGAPVDTWSLDLSGDPAWTTIDTGGQNPNGSYGMGAIYDPVRDRMLVFGGSTGADYLGAQNNLWELTLADSTAWHQLSMGDSTSTSLPKARRTMAAIYDPMRDRMVIYSGYDALTNYTSSFLGDTWALSLSGDLGWQQLSPTGPLPTGRDATAAIYDPIGDRMVLYGGWSGDTMLGDTEYLTWGEAPSTATLTASAHAAPGSASLHWGVSNSTGTHTAVYRSGPNQPWSSIATVDRDAGGAVTFVDHSVVSGANYSYQLAVSSQSGETFGGNVAVHVPTLAEVAPAGEAAFALHRVQPNPLVDRFSISFALPNGDPARVDVLDLSGRRVLSREVGSLGAGAHVLELGSTRQFAPGMYFVRLSRGGEALTTRAVVVGGGN